MIYINTDILSAFAKIGKLQLIGNLFSHNLHVSPSILQEIKISLEEGYSFAKGKVIGIDFGSTYLKMAYNGQVIPNREGEVVTPAVVGCYRGEIVVGLRAVDLHELTPQDTVSFIRPQIGQDTLSKLGHREYSPVELSSLLLRKLKQDAELYLNDKAERAVITVPAYFTEIQRDAISKAGLMAGFSMVDLLDEPLAALIGSSINFNEAKTVFVYDLGGATFDISVLTIVGGKIEIRTIEGDPWLGGNTFDQKIMDYVLDYIRNKFEVNARRDSRFMMALNKEVEKAKITLSNLENTKICLSGKLQNNQVIIDVELTRKQFEQMIEAEVKKTIDLVRRAMINANLTVDSIDHVLLVGGSTKIPLVQRELTGVFGKDKIRREVDPISCIARGVSIYAAHLFDLAYLGIDFGTTSTAVPMANAIEKESLEETQETINLVMVSEFVLAKYGWLLDPLQANRLRNIIEETRRAINRKKEAELVSLGKKLAEVIHNLPQVVDILIYASAVASEIERKDPFKARHILDKCKEIEKFLRLGKKEPSKEIKELFQIIEESHDQMRIITEGAGAIRAEGRLAIRRKIREEEAKLEKLEKLVSQMFKESRFDEAISLLQSLSHKEKPPENIDQLLSIAYEGKANQLANSGKIEEAISLLQKVLELRPKEEKTIEALATLHNNLGVEYANKGKFGEAIRELEKALQYVPKNEFIRKNVAMAYSARGVELFNSKNLEAGLRFLEMAYQLVTADDSIRSNVALAYSIAGIELYEKGEFRQARQFAEKALSFGIKGELGKTIRENVDIVQTGKSLQEISEKITTSTLKAFLRTIGKMFKVPKKQPRKAEVRRITPHYTDVSFPAEVNIDQWEDLRVAIVRKEVVTPEGEVKIQPKPHEHDVEVEVEIPEPPAPGEPPPHIIVNVLVTTPDFEIQGNRFTRIVVPLDADSKPATFKLMAKAIGQKKITVDFIQDGRYLGVVNLEVKVIESYKVAREGNASTESNVEIGDIYDAPDLTLLIQEFSLHGPSAELRYTLTSPPNKLNLFYADFGSQVFSGSIKSWVEGMIQRIEELPGKKVSPRIIEDRLTAIGNNLYDQVIPENLKHFYWANKDRIKSMVVVSDEPWIPWEIVKPYRSNDTIEQEDFFCRSFSLTRWLRGSAPPIKISLNPGKILGVKAAKGRRDIFVIPKKRKRKIDLEGIVKEVEFLCSLGKRGLEVEVISPKLEEVYELLRSGQFRLFHLCSHGTYDSQSPDHSFIQLLDGSISPEDIVGKRFRDKPFVFLNVCHAARAGYSLTRIGNWASRFFEAGCSGFVGSFWSVDDELAYQFAREFYPRLLDGIPLGEAFRQAREKVRRQNPSNPTWLAYCLYGDPLAKVY